MEKIKVLEFLADTGSGNGSGHGSGNGSGHGAGHGAGEGAGEGADNGSGDSYTYSFDDGNGNGYGSINGSGDGSGYGYGNGCGFSDGSGSGDGYHSSSGKYNNVRICHYLDKEVYYADDIPTIFLNIKGNVAKVQWISTDDFSAKDGYLVKGDGYLAHGKTVKEAFNSLKEKIFSNLNFEDRLLEFKKNFLPNKKYKGTEFFVWHGLLTGSCLAGRESFVKSNNIDLKAGYTVSEFLSLCKGAYGWDKIKEVE